MDKEMHQPILEILGLLIGIAIALFCLAFCVTIVWSCLKLCLRGTRFLTRWLFGGNDQRKEEATRRLRRRNSDSDFNMAAKHTTNQSTKSMSHDYIRHVVSSGLELGLKLQLLRSYCKSLVYGWPRKSDLIHELRGLLLSANNNRSVYQTTYPSSRLALAFDDFNDVLATNWNQDLKFFVLEECCKCVLYYSLPAYQRDSYFRQKREDLSSDDDDDDDYGDDVDYTRMFSGGYECAETNVWDLHGYKVVDAIELVKKVLARYQRGSGKRVKFITGQGIHSKNKRPVIRPAVRKLLKSEGYKCNWENAGMVVVKM